MTQASESTGYWRNTLRATGVLLAVWGFTTVVVALFAPGIAGSFIGFPAGYWLAAQGALLTFLGIVVASVVWMNRIDARQQPPADAGEPLDADS